MNAIILAFKALFGEIEEMSKSLVLGTNYHKLLNLQVAAQQESYFEEYEGVEFNPETLELTIGE